MHARVVEIRAGEKEEVDCLTLFQSWRTCRRLSLPWVRQDARQCLSGTNRGISEVGEMVANAPLIVLSLTRVQRNIDGSGPSQTQKPFLPQTGSSVYGR